ncbi:MAG: AIR carboxylase family protein [Oligoflexus sp.]
MSDILILCDDHQHLALLDQGLDALRELGIPFSLRLSSAHKAPGSLQVLLEGFAANQGKVLICAAEQATLQASFVAAYSCLPVLVVNLGIDQESEAKAVAMPAGFPLAFFGSGSSAFVNACTYAAQILSVHDQALKEKLRLDRLRLLAQLTEADVEQRLDFSPMEQDSLTPLAKN